jgi:flagellar protein FlaJ
MSIFPAAAYEARRILLDVDVYGLDPVSALEKAAKYSASKPFSELLSGYTTVLRTGGDHVNYLNLTPRSATIVSYDDRCRCCKGVLGPLRSLLLDHSFHPSSCQARNNAEICHLVTCS